MKTCPKCNTENPLDSRFCQNCGYSLLEVAGVQEDPYLGRTFAQKFLVQQVLGHGAMGKVYLCEHLTLGKSICIKILHPHLAEDRSLAKRFHREARAASRLSHPNSIQVIDFGQSEDGVLYLAMEYVAGIDLRRVIKRDFPFQGGRIVRILGQVLSALEEAHGQGVIHRDLKPENIMVADARAERDLIKVLDFGIAKIQEPGPEGGTLTVAGIVCGTPEYMAPEQARGDPLDARVDLYAAGVILYQLLTGELPFKADSALATVTKHLTEQPIPPHIRRPDLVIDPRLEGICLRAMSKDRDLRFHSALEMKLEIDSILHTIEGTSSGAVTGANPQQTSSGGYTSSVPYVRAGGAASVPPTSGSQWAVGAAGSTASGQNARAANPAGGGASASFSGLPGASQSGGSGPSFAAGPLPSHGHEGPTQTGGGTQTPLAFSVEEQGPPGRREKSSGLAAWVAAGAIVILGGTGVVLWKLEVGPFAPSKPSAARGGPAPSAAPPPIAQAEPQKSLEVARPSEPSKVITVSTDGGAAAAGAATTPATGSAAAAAAGSEPAVADEDETKKKRRVAVRPAEDHEAALKLALAGTGRSVVTTVGTNPPPPTRVDPPPQDDPPKRKVPTRDPARARAAYEEGLRAVRARSMATAVAKLKEAVLYSPTTPEYHRDLARAHRMNGQQSNAVWHYNRYVRLAPDASDLEAVRKFVGAP